MKVAVEGCCHGELDAIYGHISKLEKEFNYKVDLLLICGDFQAIRNHQDLQCMAVPAKFRKLGGFHRYYTGDKKAPLLTILIGGNHEASNYFWELYHGGWIAPNIYFLGHAGCVQVNGVRIAGASGIFKGHDFSHGHWEKLPYDNSAMRSIYHIREFNVKRLSLLSSPDIFLSHDWPQGIEHYGNVRGLLQRKPFFRADVEHGRLGSPPLMGLLMNLQPRWWFSAHLHVRFEATVTHGQGQEPLVSPMNTAASFRVENPDEIVIGDLDEEPQTQTSPPHQPYPANQALPFPGSTRINAEDSNPDEIVLDDEMDDVIMPPKPVERRETKFLALDKCLPRRQFLEVIDVPADAALLKASDSEEAAQPTLAYDPEWLAITRAFHPFLSTARQQRRLPDEHQAREMVRTELEWVLANVGDKMTRNGLKEITDCQVFLPTAPGPGEEGDAKFQQPPWYTNPQTTAFCSMLQIENKINPPPGKMEPPLGAPQMAPHDGV